MTLPRLALFAATLVAAAGLANAAPLLPTGLALNEVQPNPSGTDAGHEWVEIHNPTAFDVVLDGWTITDGETGVGGGADALDGLVVPAFGHLVVVLVEPRLANAGDDLALVAPGGAVVDAVRWGAGAEPVPAEGASLARGRLVDASWYEEDAPSPGAANDVRTPAP